MDAWMFPGISGLEILSAGWISPRVGASSGQELLQLQFWSCFFPPTPHCAGGPVFPKIPGFQAGWIFQSVVDAATAALEEENKFLPPLCSSAEGSQL